MLGAVVFLFASTPAPLAAVDPSPVPAPPVVEPPLVEPDDAPRLLDPSTEADAGASIAAVGDFSVPGFQDVPVFTGLTGPIAVDFAPNGRVFVAEKSGIIKVYDSITDSSPTTWADLRTNVHDYWDRGLLGMAIDPDFATTGRVFVSYTYNSASPRWPDGSCPTPSVGCLVHGRLSVLTHPGTGLATEQVLITDWCQQFPSHSMSDIVFDDAKALYVNGGDGANFDTTDHGQFGNPCNDPPNEGGALRSQDIRTTADPVGLNGTVIRVDRAGQPLADNPGSGSTNARRIVAYGLRNPFRMVVHPTTGNLWIGDVGWADYEEINRHSDPDDAVRNFGWPCREGSDLVPSGYDAVPLCSSPPPGLTNPHFAYHRGSAVVSGDGCGGTGTISGLAFYEGGPYPAAYDNALFFTDYSRECLWVMRDTNADGVPDPGSRAHFTDVPNPVHLTVGTGGDLFYVDHLGGAVRRISYIGANSPPDARVSASDTTVMVGQQVNFSATASTDPNGDSLTYAWDFGDNDGQFNDATGGTTSHTYATPGSYIARVRVSDGRGGQDIAQITIHVDNQPPTATITSPGSSLRWSAGQTISYSGTGTDPDDGSLAASAFTWQLILHHCPNSVCHQHPIGTFTGAKTGSFTAPDHEYPAHLELRLTVKDDDGASHTTSRTLLPATVNLRIESSPPGLRITAGWVTRAAPFTLTAISGSRIQLNAPSPQTSGGFPLSWQSWSDGGAREHTVTASASRTYRATFAGGFTDVADSQFRGDIAWLARTGITAGCSPTRFCPDAPVTREQMASFLVRALGLTAGTTPDRFTDIASSGHRGDINRLATAEITAGCTATRFCPSAQVRREQMASFLARALELTGPAPDAFTDDERSQHEGDINRLAREGVTGGCATNRFCPSAVVTRGQMAAFLHRAFADRFP